jgi:signal transduction histidine kinase/ActR/RegA family two-component response regulator
MFLTPAAAMAEGNSGSNEGGSASTVLLVVIIVLVVALVVCVLLMLRQKKVNQRLARREALVREMPVLYAQVQLTMGSGDTPTDYAFVAANSAFNQLYDANRDDFKAHHDEILQYAARVVKEQKTVSFPLYFGQQHVYCEFALCNSREKGFQLDLFAFDISSRHEMEEELREDKKKMDMTFALSHVVPFVWNLEQQSISFETSLNILNSANWSAIVADGKNGYRLSVEEFTQRVHPDDRQLIQKVYSEVVQGSEKLLRQEVRIQMRNEVKTYEDWLEFVVAPWQKTPDGRVLSLIGSFALVTDRKRREQSLIDAGERAKESDRMKSAFLANMSHEIRTPLNAIVGFSNLLAQTDNEQERLEYVSVIENNNQLLLQLVNDILDFAKIESNTLELTYKPTDLNELIRDVDNTVRGRLQPGVELLHSSGTDHCITMGDANRLSQVLINLLTNAIKFTPNGSITFGYMLRENEVYFFVRDTGMGIPKEQQKSIFNRFIKLNKTIQGTGLGLSICKNLVELMNGQIGVESDGVGQGSTFWFTVPYQPVGSDGQPVKVQPAQVRRPVSSGRATILVAEDNDNNYLLFKSILQNDYQLLHAHDGVEAVELFNANQPDLILMDINMPRMDGNEATREIRKVSETVPIVAVTAYAFASDKERIMENGFNEYVSKPINVKRLREVVKAMLERRKS